MNASKVVASPLLAVALDPQVRAHRIGDTEEWLLKRLDQLARTGVIIKVHMDLLMMLHPGFVVEELHDRGHALFCDVKVAGADSELVQIAAMLASFGVDYVTLMATRPSAMRVFKEQLSNAAVFVVAVPTDWTEEDCWERYGRDIRSQTLFDAEHALREGIDGMVCAPTDAEAVRDTFNGALMRVTPDIRPVGLPVVGETQNLKRSMTPGGAISAGSDMLVVGRPVAQAESPGDAVRSILEQMQVPSSAQKQASA